MKAGIDAITKKSTTEEAGDETMQSEDALLGSSATVNESIQYSCDTCGVDCTASRYHSIRRVKGDAEEAFDVCPACYSEGRFPSNLFSGDFLRLNSEMTYRKSLSDGQEWSDQETLLLLEGLEMFNDDWDKISEHVGSRTREACVAHFLQLPIEDDFLINEGGGGGGVRGVNGAATASMLGRVDQLPFSQPDHPVLSVVAFLASVVDPEVAAKAASESIDELTKGLKRKADTQRQDNGEVGPGEGTENGMVVDGQPQERESSSKPNTAARHRSANLALASAGSKAHLLAQQTSAELTSHIHSLVSTQVTKLSLKLSQFESLEASLDNERRQIEIARQLLQMERLGIEKQMDAIGQVSKKVATGEMVQQAEVDRLRELNNSSGSYRSGMPPKVVQVQGPIPPLHGQTANYVKIE